MTFCSKCGMNNPPEGRFCLSCGSPLAIAGPTPATNYPAPNPIPQKPSTEAARDDYKRSRKAYQTALRNDPRRKRGVVIVSIVCLLMIGSMFAFAYSADHGKGWFGSSATIYIKASSTHISNTVTVTMTVNGVEVAKESLSPFSSMTYDFKAMFFADAETYTIVVTSEGGGLGNYHDSRTVTVEKGDTQNVAFLI